MATFMQGDSVYCPVIDMYGEVIVVDEDEWIGVRFHGWNQGHDLDGFLPRGSHEGYWLRPNDLELICEVEDNSEKLAELFDELF